VAISWGQGVKGQKATNDAATSGGKKVPPLVGKMPWLKKDGGGTGTSSPTPTSTGGRVSKFGPPVTAVAMTVPPPMLVTAVPTLGQQQQQPPPPPMPPVSSIIPPPTAIISVPPPAATGDFNYSHIPPPPLPADNKPKVGHGKYRVRAVLTPFLLSLQKRLQNHCLIDCPVSSLICY